MRLFNLDSPLMQFLTKLANLMILNLLTILCCIPIFTAGAAITALYYVTIKMARGDDPYIVRSYFKSFKENFKQATIIWLIMLALIFVIAMDWRVIYVMMEGTAATVMKVVIFVVTAFLLLTGLYIFPVLSRFENSIKNTIKNAFLISILNLPRSVLIVLIHLIPVAAVLLTIQALPFVFLLGIPVVAYLASKLYAKMFKRFEPEEENAGDGEELAPLSFIVEEQQAKQAALEAERKAAQDAQTVKKSAPAIENPTSGPEGESGQEQ